MSFLPSHPDHSLLNVLLDHPALTPPLMAYTEALMRGPSPFTPQERETIFAYVSGVNECDFCRTSHTVCVEALGAPAGGIDALLADPALAAAPPKLAPVLRYARKLTKTPERMVKTDAEAILAAGWDETALVHAAMVTGIANFYNRVVGGLGIPADEAPVQMGGRMLASAGYEAITGMLPA